MSVRIYDTLARAKIELQPRDPGRVSMYVCGPTVYDDPHVGHGRTAIVFDVVRRYLEWRGLNVRFVSNVTDVDDKIIARASERRSTEPEIARFFEDRYWSQLQRLGVRRPDEVPHATGWIPAMIRLVTELLERGHAYVVPERGVYFDVGSSPDYGALPHRSLEQLLESAGARVEIDDAKRAPVDFALWKAAKAGEPAWDSPWGPGRPGWHIECSAMSLELLGDGFDVHGAGGDLVFPHNENERAQAEAAGHPFARHWLHSGMVEVGGEKMSKSLGNFRTLEEALDAYGPRPLRLAVVRSHYRRAMDLGDPELGDAAKALSRLDALARRAAAAGIIAAGEPDRDLVGRFVEAMDDDFATPAAVATIFEAATAANQAIDGGDSIRAGVALRTVVDLAEVLGLEVGPLPGENAEIDAETDAQIDALVAAREQARAEHDFVAADAIRDELASRGIVLEDTPGGTVWHRGVPSG